MYELSSGKKKHVEQTAWRSYTPAVESDVDNDDIGNS